VKVIAVMTHTYAKSQVKGESVNTIEWNGNKRTDTTDRITFPVIAVGNESGGARTTKG